MKILTKKIFLYLGLILAVGSCKSESESSTNVVDEHTMAKILADIHLTEAKVSRMTFNDYDSTKVAYKEFERRIMAKYKVDTAQYRQSYNFYAIHPPQMILIYDEAMKILEDKKKKKLVD